MAIRTVLTETFSLEYPIVLAPMGSVAGGRLAAAVSNAGALGLVGPSDSLSPSSFAPAAGRSRTILFSEVTRVTSVGYPRGTYSEQVAGGLGGGDAY